MAAKYVFSLIDEEALRYCRNKGICVDVFICYEIILGTFKNIKDVKIYLDYDCEIQSLCLVRFDVVVDDGIDSIIRCEAEFYNKLRKETTRSFYESFILIPIIYSCKDHTHYGK